MTEAQYLHMALSAGLDRDTALRMEISSVLELIEIKAKAAQEAREGAKR